MKLARFRPKSSILLTLLFALPLLSYGENTPANNVLIRDITTIAGVRENPLIGYGLVVGLNGTGDSRQTFFTTQALANVMRRLGVQIPAAAVRVNNVAAVFVTASLPAFAHSGTQLDVTVSSIGDAKSLEGGTLLLTPLNGPDGQTYAEAQGSLTLGGYSTGAAGNSKQVNHATVGRIPEGGTVERELAVDLSHLSIVSFALREPDFTAASEIAQAVNQSFGKPAATALDSRRIDIKVSSTGMTSVPELISKIQNLSIAFRAPAKVIINERTGTIVMGGDVKLSPVAVLHGNLTVEVTTDFTVSQPNGFSKGETTVVPQTSVKAADSPARKIELAEGANVQQLIAGLQSIGATARDIVAIIQAIKAAGGLQAELEVL